MPSCTIESGSAEEDGYREGRSGGEGLGRGVMRWRGGGLRLLVYILVSEVFDDSNIDPSLLSEDSRLDEAQWVYLLSS